MIVVAIIGILVAIAIPSYKNYTRRAHFTEIVQATAPYKVGVEECFSTMGALDNCQAGQYGIPAPIIHGQGNGLVDQISVKAGVIVVIPQNKFGIKPEDTYQLTPKVENNALSWVASGGGVEHGYAS